MRRGLLDEFSHLGFCFSDSNTCGYNMDDELINTVFSLDSEKLLPMVNMHCMKLFSTEIEEAQEIERDRIRNTAR
jgi:hypothetical protein